MQSPATVRRVRAIVPAALAATAVAAVAVVGAATTAGGGGPTPTTEAAQRQTTAAPTTAAPPPTLPLPPSRDADPVGALVPTLIVDPQVLNPRQQTATVDELLANPRRSVAAAQAGTICAAANLSTPLTARAWWERNGETIRRVDEAVRRPPGFGDCLSTDGDRLPDGTYQFVVAGPTGATSAAPTFVVGTGAVWAVFRNNGAGPVCMLYISPRQADRFEAHRLDPPLAPGRLARVAVAATEQEVEVFECPASGDLGGATRAASFSLIPVHNTPTDLFPGD